MSSKRHSKVKTPSYFVFFKDEKIKVNPVEFAKNSKKFEENYEQNPDGLEIKENVSQEALMIFLRMCQNKDFEITYDTAQELITLTRNWQCPLLERYVIDFCHEHNLIVRPKYDPIGLLLEAIDNNCEGVHEITEVAKVLNDSFDDDRLPDIELELLFKIVITAEKDYNLDLQKYKKFVLQMFKSNPSTAVILSLKLPFDDLTNDELRVLQECKDMRIQSLSFFFANALSIVKNNVDRRLTQMNEDMFISIDKARREMDLRERLFRYELEQYQKEKKEIIEKRLSEQQEEIEGIYQELLVQAARLDGGLLSENGLIDKRLLRLQANTNNMIKQIHQAVQESLDEPRENRHQIVKSNVAKRFVVWDRNYSDPDYMLKEIQNRLIETGDVYNKLEDRRQEIDADLKNIQATIKSKIMRDKLRPDKSRRNTDERYSIFEPDERADIVKAGRTIQDIENKIEQYCPFRGH